MFELLREKIGGNLIYQTVASPTMIALTTRQRDLLQHLLVANKPMATAEIAQHMQLTSRQVNYGLKGVERWLKPNGYGLTVKPGIGIVIACSDLARADLLQMLSSESSFQLVLSASQRQQLIILKLLLADEPLILYNLQQLADVSRTTVLKDLEQVTPWLEAHSFVLERRPNYGLWVDGSEEAYRRAFAALLWGDSAFDEPLWRMTFDGLQFDLADDAHLLDTLQMVRNFITQVQTRAGMAHVAYAEADLGGRFTDNSVLYLALVLAVQAHRIRSGHLLDETPSELDWLLKHPVWGTANNILKTINLPEDPKSCKAETASIALQILASPKNTRWPGDLDIDDGYVSLIADIMERVGITYELPHLAYDSTLRDGLVAIVIPACLRTQFNLWSPSRTIESLDRQTYADEYDIARELTGLIKKKTAVYLEGNEISNLVLLLRAAYIRERPQRTREVIVVCPSGMATAQLLVARLKARFPHLGILNVISLRELSPDVVDTAELILTTVPISKNSTDANIIQVHPLLLPEDIAAITQWLA